MNDSRSDASYVASASRDDAPRANDFHAASAASRPRLDRVVNALQRRHVDETDAVAAQQQPRRMEPLRERDEPALRDRLRAPLHALAALEDPADARMRLQLLQARRAPTARRRGSRGDDHADRDQVVAHRIDERAAELAIAAPRPQRPAHRVHHFTKRLRDLPDLLHPERPHLRVVAGGSPKRSSATPVRLTLRPLREDRHARGDVGARLEVRQLFSRATAPTVAGAHTDDAAHRRRAVFPPTSRAGS